jgi:hypothetical protein
LANSIVITQDTAEADKSYDDSDTTTRAALNILTNGVTYSGTNITLSATNNSTRSSNAIGNGAYIDNGARLSLTNGTVSATGNNGNGVYLSNASSGTLNNVNIKTEGSSSNGADAIFRSSLTMTGGTISTTGEIARGVSISSTSSGTLNNVNIKTEGDVSYGVSVSNISTLTMTGGTVSITGNYGYGVIIVRSSGTLNNVNVKTEGTSSHAVYVTDTSALALTDSDISATGSNANAFYLLSRSTATASLNHNTITGNIRASGTASLTITGSNGTVLTGNVTGATGATIAITLTGEGSALHGNISQSSDTTVINLTIGADALFDGAGELDHLTLDPGARLGYTDVLTVTTSITIGDNITIDFSRLTETDNYLVLDWTGAEVTGSISDDQFTATNAEGTFSVQGTQLYFNATAVPEPSTWFLLGIGLGTLALIRRRRAGR